MLKKFFLWLKSLKPKSQSRCTSYRVLLSTLALVILVSCGAQEDWPSETVEKEGTFTSAFQGNAPNRNYALKAVQNFRNRKLVIELSWRRQDEFESYAISRRGDDKVGLITANRDEPFFVDEDVRLNSPYRYELLVLHLQKGGYTKVGEVEITPK